MSEKFLLSTKSKSEYLHCLDILKKNNATIIEAVGNDWDCKFSIVFFIDVIPEAILQKEKRFMSYGRQATGRADFWAQAH